MKRVPFLMAGLTVAVVFSGCETSTGPMKGDLGKPLTTATGARIEVVAVPNNPPPQEVSNDATMKDRMKARSEAASRPVQVSTSDAEVARTVLKDVEKDVSEAVRASAGDVSQFKKSVVYVDGHPQVTKAAIERAAKKQLSEGALIALRAMLAEALEKELREKVYPEMIKKTLERLGPMVEKAVAEGKYSVARNAIWSASTCGIPEVDAAVREKAVELMHFKVNPANWEVVAPKLEQVFKKAMDDKAYDRGIAEIQALEKASIQQEYSVLLDKKISAIKKELAAIGIPEKDMKPILDKQGAIIAEAAKILDVMDEVMTLEESKKERHEVSPRQDPALKVYYEKLDDFRETLVKYNCEKGKAEAIAVDLDEELIALINLLRKPAVFEDSETKGKTALRLGTRSLNKRIRKAAADYVAKLDAAKVAAHIAEIRAKLEAAKKDLLEKVKALVAEKKFEEARELIWNASVTGDAEWDSVMFAFGLELLRDIVNPADWMRIEQEINGKFAELSAAGKYDELTKYLQSYPRIRQHTVKLDEQLARVRKEAEALGANPDKAAEAARAACSMVAEAEALVDHLDKMVAESAAAGKKIDERQLQAELDAYAKKLAAYHATPANVAKIVDQLKLALTKLIAAPDGAAKKRLALGTNAVNDRIGALTKKLLDSIAETKRAWEEKTYEKLVSDLEQRVRAAVREKRFAEARDIIRDEKLIGRQDLDLQLYVLRVGLLDSCVNPAQLDFLLAEIDAKTKAFVEKEDYPGLEAYVRNYPYVHDTYAKIDAALAAVRKEMLALEIPTAECDGDEKVRFAGAIRAMLEKRREAWKPARDLKPVEKALADVAKAIFDHMNKHPTDIEAERKAEYDHILSDIAKLDRTITTWELNEKLRQRLAKEEPIVAAGLAMLKVKAARQAYLDALAKIDAEVSFDAQIAMAEEAISRQLGQRCEKASYKINAVLGEYARAFRLLKKKAELKPAEATSMLLGAAYLGQGAVIPYAIKLGADVNGVSVRDPRRRTALMLAVDAQNLALMKTLAEAGASAKAADANGNAVLHYAVKSGSVTAVRVLAKEAPMDVVNKAGETPLFEAVKRNQAAMAKTVLDIVDEKSRVDFVNKADASGQTAMALAVRLGSRDVLDALAGAGALYSEKELILAEENDHVAIAQWLVEQGVDVNADGVMAKACPATATGRYLIGEGGVGEHSCEDCKPTKAGPAAKKENPPAAGKPAAPKVEAAGTITFKVADVEAK